MHRLLTAAVLAVAVLGTVACDVSDDAPPPAPVSVPAVPGSPVPGPGGDRGGPGVPGGTVAPPPALDNRSDDADDRPDGRPDDAG